MIHSMTGYGLATRQAPLTNAQGEPSGRTASVSVEFRTVNSRFLDLLFRAPEECRAFEPALREMLMGELSRGKLECRINLQRTDTGGATLALNQGLLDQIRALESTVAATFASAGTMRMGEILRWPGVLVEPELSQESLREEIGRASCRERVSSPV